MTTWPTSLPQKFNSTGYTESEPDLAIRTQMDAGPDKVRRRFTAGVRPVTTTLRLDTVQKETLKNFFLTELFGGTLSFTWVLPGTSTGATYRFAAPPQYTPLGGDRWLAALNLEVLP